MIVDSIVAVFDFIFSLLETIIDGVTGTVSILTNVISLIFTIIQILPQQLYIITYAFVSILSLLFVYKLFRKG